MRRSNRGPTSAPATTARVTPRSWHRLGYVSTELRRRITTTIADLSVPEGGTVLDFGCGSSPYRDAFGAVRYVRADISPTVEPDLLVAPDGSLPLEDHSVDVVLSTQVLEHAADPQAYVGECARVLKPGGRLVLTTHGVMFYHPDPEDYWRWTPAGLETLLASAGFRISRLDGVLGLTAAGLTLAYEPLAHALPAVLRRPISLLVYLACRLADRLEPVGYRRHNALVFSVVAETGSERA